MCFPPGPHTVPPSKPQAVIGCTFFTRCRESGTCQWPCRRWRSQRTRCLTGNDTVKRHCGCVQHVDVDALAGIWPRDPLEEFHRETIPLKVSTKHAWHSGSRSGLVKPYPRHTLLQSSTSFVMCSMRCTSPSAMASPPLSSSSGRFSDHQERQAGQTGINWPVGSRSVPAPQTVDRIH